MAINVAADLAAIVTSGDIPTTAGTLQRDGDHEFTALMITSRRRSPTRNGVDVEELDAILLASDVDIDARADDRIELADASAWTVVSSSPIAPAGTAVGWVLLLRTWTER